jgi:hypothetical protein
MADDRLPNGRFAPGTSGNPAGLKPGTKHRKTLILEELEKDGSALATAIKAAALTGDTSAMSLWLTRLEPAVRARGETIEFPLDVNAPVEDQLKQVLQAIADGEISVDGGSMLIANIEKLANVRATANAGSHADALIQAMRDFAAKAPV